MAPATRSILIVDDEPNILSSLIQLLQRAGYEVAAAANGKEALTLLGQRRFDIILTDLFMPEVDGAQLMMAARKQQPEAAVVAMSGGGVYMSPTEALAMARRLGARAVLAKPFSREQLVACLDGLNA